LDGHLLGQFGEGDVLAYGHFSHDRPGRALEAVLVALLQAALATAATTTEAFALVSDVAGDDARRRALVLEGRTLGALAITTLVVVAGTLGATRLCLLALFGRRLGGRCGGCRSRRLGGLGSLALGFQARLAGGLFSSLATGLFLGLLARGLLGGALRSAERRVGRDGGGS